MQAKRWHRIKKNFSNESFSDSHLIRNKLDFTKLSKDIDSVKIQPKKILSFSFHFPTFSQQPNKPSTERVIKQQFLLIKILYRKRNKQSERKTWRRATRGGRNAPCRRREGTEQEHWLLDNSTSLASSVPLPFASLPFSYFSFMILSVLIFDLKHCCCSCCYLDLINNPT